MLNETKTTVKKVKRGKWLVTHTTVEEFRSEEKAILSWDNEYGSQDYVDDLKKAFKKEKIRRKK